MFRHACKLRFEGIVSKRLGSPYRSGRSRDWIKSKNPAAPVVKREAEEGQGALAVSAAQEALAAPDTMPINLKPHERELVENTLEDLHHIAKEAGPQADDHQLRRISVQLRQLLVDDYLIRSWRLLQLEPRAPTIIAPRLRPEQYGSDDFAVAGGGMVGGLAVGAVHVMPGKAVSPEEVKAIYEQGKGDIEFPFRLADFKQSCAVYVKRQKVSRQQLVQYVANKKGGAHLDRSRKKDEQAYSTLDNATEAVKVKGDEKLPAKNTIYLELLSIGQNLTKSPDIKRFMEAAEAVLASK